MMDLRRWWSPFLSNIESSSHDPPFYCCGGANPYAPPFYLVNMKKRVNRPDMGEFRSAYERNRKIVLASAEVCAICGMPIDKKKHFPDPMSVTVDHIIPIAKGGHPFSPENLQAAHLICNQIKGSRTTIEMNKNLVEEKRIIGNRELPLSRDWKAYS